MNKGLEFIDNTNPSEVLEYLDFIGENCYIEAGNAEEDCILYAKDYFGFNTIKQALLALKAIKESDSNEALGLIKKTCELYLDTLRNLIGYDIVERQINEALDTIKQVIIKAQEQEKELNEYKKALASSKKLEDKINEIYQGYTNKEFELLMENRNLRKKIEELEQEKRAVKDNENMSKVLADE